MKTEILITLLILFFANGAFAAPFLVSADGQEVTDTKTGLVWRRCPEGMLFSGSGCSGAPLTLARNVGYQWARTQAPSGWRLPNVKELSSIVDRSRIDTSIDIVAFPNTVSYSFLTSSPLVTGPDYWWVVNFELGNVGITDKGVFHVRLVRAGQ